MIDYAYQHWIIPGFETVLKRRKTFQYLSSLEESQWWSRERLEALQLDRLHSLLTYCVRHSTYYRERWADLRLVPEDVLSLTDFRHWPIMTRETMRDRAHDVRSDASGITVVAKSTGGSSGTPLSFLIDHEANERRTAAAYRGYGWAGARAGTRQTHLWGFPLGEQVWWKRWKEHAYSRYIHRRDVLNSFDLSDQVVPEFLQRINRFHPDVLVAYTNPLYSLARAVEERGLPVFGPKAIIVGAEKLHGFQRTLIERVFQAPVFETYGSREFTLIGAECDQHAGLHLTMEYQLVEIVDDFGQPTPTGEEGNVVVTDLTNRAMPFIRYVTGDRAISGFATCNCGRGSPLLKEVCGRKLDIIDTVDGRHLPGEFFPHLVKDYAAIRKFQVVQREVDLVELKLVVDDRWNDECRESLRREIQTAMGEVTRLVIREVEKIPLTRMGKLRVVVGASSLSHHAADNGISAGV